MRFALAKYTLTHFAKSSKFDMNAPVTLGETTVSPKPSVKVLGVILDSKLKWKDHKQAVKQKLATQMLALQRTTASTWGATMLKARQVYQAVVRPAIAYGAPAWHQPTKAGGKPKGLAAKLQAEQNKGLRVVLGAFKATSTRRLEVEAYVPPIDLWLNGRIARYQARIDSSGIGKVIQNACTVVRNKLRNRLQVRRTRNGPAKTTPSVASREWAEKWTGKPIGQWDQREKPLVARDWTERWTRASGTQDNRPLWPGTDPGGGQVGLDPAPTAQVLSLHKSLQKAESAMLVQARTGKIGLGKFLHDRKVPGFETAQCRCGAGFETPRHMVLYCIEEAGRRGQLTDQAGRKWTYGQLTGRAQATKGFARWMMGSGRLGQFALAKRLLYGSE